MRILFLLLSICILSVPVQADDNENQPAWQWSTEKINATVNKIRAGQDLQPAQWPDGNRIAVLFSFDADNETNTLSRGGTPDPLLLSMEQYGARKGLQRILALLDRHEVPGNLFYPRGEPAACARNGRLDQAIRPSRIRRAWLDPCKCYRNDERTGKKISSGKSRDYLESQTGERPVGYRAPFGVYSENTHSILEELGFLYDSGLAADDSPHALTVNGEPIQLIELPGNVNFEDSVLDPMNTFTAGLVTPGDLLQTFKDGFDTLYEEGTMMLFILHPHISGRASRIGIYDKLIKYMKQHEGVWFATHRQAAEYVSALQK